MSHTHTPASPHYPGGPQMVPPGSNGVATAGFVLGLLGLLGSWVPVVNIIALILGVLGAILSAIGLAKAKSARSGKGLAIAGLVLGVLAVIVAIVVNVAVVGAVDDALDDATGTTVEAPGDSRQESEAQDGETAGEGEQGTTRDNPAPLGSRISGGDWAVVVNSVDTIDQDSLGQRAASGSTLLKLNLTATYNGDDEQGESPFSTVSFVSADGTTVDGTGGSTLFIADDEFDSMQTVFNGASVTGDQILEVPGGWEQGVLAVSPDLLSDDTFVALR